MKSTLPVQEPIKANATVDVAAAVAGLQQSLRAIFEALPVYPTKPPDLQRLLAIDRNLAWKAHRLVHARTPAEAAGFVPGAAAMGILADAARRAGVDEPATSRLFEAFQTYEQVVQVHAGDRATARLMLESDRAGSEGGNDLGLRRAAFRAGGFVAGVRARAQLQSYIVWPGRQQGWMNLVALRGYYDVERLRPDALFLMPRLKSAKAGDDHFGEPKVQPLDRGEPDQRVPLIREFCSRPVPIFREVVREDGGMEDELTDWNVGRTGAATVVAGILSRDHFNSTAQREGETSRLGARIRVPCEVLVLDEFVHRDAYRAVAPDVEVYSELSGDASWFTRRATGLRVPINVKVERLGAGLGGAATADIPRYGPLLRYAFDRAGLDPADFDGFRVRIEFPLLPTGVSLVRPKLALVPP